MNVNLDTIIIVGFFLLFLFIELLIEYKSLKHLEDIDLNDYEEELKYNELIADQNDQIISSLNTIKSVLEKLADLEEKGVEVIQYYNPLEDIENEKDEEITEE